MPAVLDKNALVHILSQKSKTGFKEELYNHPCQVVPAMLDKNALVHNLSQKFKTGFKEELYSACGAEQECVGPQSLTEVQHGFQRGIK